MKKIFIVLLFILLGTSLIVLNSIKGTTEQSFTIKYVNNKNVSLPDLTGKTEIIDGMYRYYNENGLTIDYNIYNGIWNFNGTTTSHVGIKLFDILPDTQYTLTYLAINGTLTGGLYFLTHPPTLAIGGQVNQNIDKIFRFNITTQTQFRIDISSGTSFLNYQFKLQIEKGSISTQYVVPKLIPVYIDNLTQQEKNEIGLGAFGGITKIIKTINDIIKPVGDFINGILSWF